MNYTENYRLNQWDPEDRLLREDFNRDNANVESGLVSLKQDLQTEAQNREAAVTAAKQEASQALTAAAGSLESSKADKTALAQLQALVDAMPFVKLREVTVGTSVNQVDVDVSDIQWEKYAYILFVPRLLVSEKDEISVRINSLSGGAYTSQGQTQYHLFDFDGNMASERSSAAAQIQIAEQNNYLTAMLISSDYKGYGKIIGGSLKPEYAVSSAETVNFFCYNDVLIQKGGKIYIYGVKL